MILILPRPRPWTMPSPAPTWSVGCRRRGHLNVVAVMMAVCCCSVQEPRPQCLHLKPQSLSTLKGFRVNMRLGPLKAHRRRAAPFALLQVRFPPRHSRRRVPWPAWRPRGLLLSMRVPLLALLPVLLLSTHPRRLSQTRRAQG
jgi:hypothetical protein